MIRLSEIQVSGESEAGPFRGVLGLGPGLQVISARNAYGKSLAVTAFAWCLGIEAVLGNQDNDPSCFPEAVRDEIDLGGQTAVRVRTSECSIKLVDGNNREIQITRAIKGDSRTVGLSERLANGAIRESRLLARRGAMQDEHGGLQHFLFGWLGWPRERVSTFHGGPSEIYLENLAPAFYISQQEGWTNIQSLQISRYAQQEIAEICVEYLLGAVDAVRARVARQDASQRAAALREMARELADRVAATLLRRGWRIDWSGHGAVSDIRARWSSKTIRQALMDQAGVDLSLEEASASERAEQLRTALTSGPIDASNASAPAEASQRVIDLKQRRHELSDELHSLRIQRVQAADLLVNLEHRIGNASDLLRLKLTGVGRFDHLECPTCHRDLDPLTFALTVQSTDSVSAHIEALKRDRELMRKNVYSIDSNIEISTASLVQVEDDLRDAERSLMTVTQAIGTSREQFAQTAARLNRAERDIDRIRDCSREVDELQDGVNRWIAEAAAIMDVGVAPPDLARRREGFLLALRKYLIGLGHSAVSRENVAALSLDAQYTPLLNDRRLRALGSASDQPRLVAAYTLALAAAGVRMGGLHPGLVVLDEPLQQNPDPHHRELFTSFLTQELARQAVFQTLVFTSLRQDEIEQLRGQGTNVILPDGDHFLRPVADSENAKRN